jgi:3-phenylpropionate/trans-cinnamate dioxygenase ferredoxin subunit
MSRFVDIGAAGDLAPGTMKAVAVEERELLLARVGDAYYAADERCPHRGGRLSQGKLEGTVVVCPKHGSRFELSDGRVINWTKWTGMALSVAKTLKSPRPLKTYPVQLQDGRLLVGLD